MYYTDGAPGIGGVKSTGFDYSPSVIDNEENKKNKFDEYPGGLFTMPNPDNSVAFNFGAGGDNDGAFNA